MPLSSSGLTVYLVSCVLNNEQPDRELVLKTDPWQLYTLAKAILAHEYKHFSHRGTGMRSLMDVYVFLNAHPNLDWNYINTELQKLKLTEYEKHSRNLAQKVFKNEALSEDETEQLMMYMDSSVYGTVRPIKGLITHPKGLARDTKRVVKYKSPKHRY